MSDFVIDKQEVECDVSENEDRTGSRSTTDVTEMAEPCAASADVETTSSSEDVETAGATMKDQGGELAAPSTMTELQHTTASSYFRAQDEELQGQTPSIPTSGLQLQQQIENSREEGETEGQISTDAASLGGFDAAVNDHSPRDFPPNPQPETETVTQPESATGDSSTSSRPEVIINSDEMLASSGAQQEPAKDWMSTPDNDDMAQRETRENIAGCSELQTSTSEHFDVVHDTLTAPASTAPDGGSVGETSEEQRSDAAGQTLLDHTSTSSRPQSDDVDSTSPSNSQLASFSEEAVTSAPVEQKTTHVEEQQLGVASETDSTSPDERDLRPDEPPTDDQQLRSSAPPCADEAVVAGKVDVEPVFTFPEPPRHPCEPVTLGDDSTDDVFVEHSSAPNDVTTATSEEEMLPPSSEMTSSTAILAAAAAAAAAAAVSQQEQPLDDETAAADAAPAPPQQPGGQEEEEEAEVEASPDQLPTPVGQGRQVQVLPPTSEPSAAAAAATASVSAEDGERSAGDEKWLSDETHRADEPDFARRSLVPQSPAVDNVDTSSASCPSSGDLVTAIQPTDVACQQQDQLPQHQPTSPGAADRRPLSLLIPALDSDSGVYTSDNQVGVCLIQFTHCSVRRLQFDRLRN